MRFAGIDDAFELGVRQQAVGDEVRRQMRPVGRLGRRDRGHRRRLHELGRMRLRAGNTDRLQSVFFIERIGEAPALGRRPVDGLVGELDRLRFGSAGCGRTRRRARVGADRARRRPGDGTGDGDGGRDRQARRHVLRSPSRAAWRRRAPCPARPGTRVGSSAGTRSMTVSRVSIVVPCRA